MTERTRIRMAVAAIFMGIAAMLVSAFVLGFTLGRYGV